MNLSWLPWPAQRRPAPTRNKTTWEYVIYRTTYTPQSDTSFPQIVNVLNSYFNNGSLSEYAPLQKKLFSAEPTRYPESCSEHPPLIMADPTRFDGASIESIRDHFLSWVNKQEKRDYTTMYPTCIVVDEECLQAFLDTPLPGEKLKSDSVRDNLIRYFKVIAASPEIDEYDSFMGGEYPGDISDRSVHSSTPRGKKIAALLESDDDEYDSFLGG